MIELVNREFGRKGAANRCFACGLPGPKLLVGLWGGIPVRLMLCGRCVRDHAHPDANLARRAIAPA